MSKKYIVDDKMLRYLLECAATIDALENGDVSSWIWYGDSIETMLKVYNATSMEEVAEVDFKNLILNKKIQEYIG